MSSGLIRVRATVTGVVQGVGFRPFVYGLATRAGLDGHVGNDALGVFCELQGPADTVAQVLEALRPQAPTLARVDTVEVSTLSLIAGTGFEILASRTGGPRQAFIPADSGTCQQCLDELHDPADRRAGYAFVNCTHCGPRYTIVADVPYDRASTTMAGFTLCPDCAAEYADPADRRFHAEPVCCPVCGPRLRLLDRDGAPLPGDPVPATVALLRDGQVVAVKGLGGYHLAVDAGRQDAVAMLRGRKHREDRPFAVMVAGLEAAQRLGVLGDLQRQLLTSPARPIVLLDRVPSAPIAEAVAPGSPTVGVMLAYTPLHTLLLEAFGGPLVMTSGNVSDEPIAYIDEDAAQRLAPIADAFLTHDRAIRTRVDDSVVMVVGDRVIPVRRSRGYVPGSIGLPVTAPQPVLACGSALKNTFCLVRDDQAVVSHHIGDLDDWTTQQAYADGIAHLCRLLDLEPRWVAHDLHPDYPSTRYAHDLTGVELLGVQHHHAHIASCLADNGMFGPAIGVAFDGIGLGTDGTAWGGEFLIADLVTSVRAAHLAPVALPGGDTAARQPWRMAASHLVAAYGDDLPPGLAVRDRQGRRWEQVLAAAAAGVNAPLTSSAGRLFDAVSSLLGLRDAVTYEGQAAIELERAADPRETGRYPVAVTPGEPAVVDVAVVLRALVEDLLAGTAVPLLAARFHNTLAEIVGVVCADLRERHGLATVALSGGVFQNALLVTRCLQRLEADGFTVLTHRQVPPNDGGLCLGQAAIAAAVASQST